MIRSLVSCALTPYGRQSVLEFDFLKVDTYLNKFVEASHLIEVRLNKTGEINSQKNLLTSELSVELEYNASNEEEPEDYCSDPYIIINQFFLDGTIEDGRDDLNRLFEADLPDELISNKHYPSLLLYIFERLDKLIDATFSVN